MEEELENKINFLLPFPRTKMIFNTYREPSTSDIITPYDSCHPPTTQTDSNQISNRLSGYPMNNTEKGKKMT